MRDETHTQATYDVLFGELCRDLRVDGWEVRQETLPQAYLHVSRRGWGDEHMNGIHLEAYVLGRQLASQCGLVMLHCEGGCPFQQRFMSVFTELAGDTIRAFPGEYVVKGPNGSSVCEVAVPFAAVPQQTMVLIAAELRRLQTLAPLVDRAIAICKAEHRQA